MLQPNMLRKHLHRILRQLIMPGKHLHLILRQLTIVRNDLHRILQQRILPNKQKYFILLLLFIVSCTATEPVSKPIFQFQPQAGKLYEIAMKTVTTSELKIQTIGDTIDFRFNIKPVQIDSSGTKVLMVVQQLRLGRSAFAKPRQTALDKKFEVMMKDYFVKREQIFRTIAGDSLTLFMDNAGQLVMVDGLDALTKNISGKTTIDQGDVNGMIRDFLSPAALKDLLKEMFFYLPARPVVMKDTWVNNITLTAKAPVKYSHMMVVDTIDDDHLFLSVRSKISGGGEGTQYLDGACTGTVKADAASGFPLLMNLIEESVTTTTAGERKNRRQIITTCLIRSTK